MRSPGDSRGLVWGAGVALAVAGLCVQVLVHRFDSWNRDPFLRPVYGAACALLPCASPTSRPARDIAVRDIAVRDIAVRAHPRIVGGVVVEAAVRNEASFSQPFPRLELRLSNAAGEVVAARRFAPAQYLGGRYPPDAPMPAMTRVLAVVEIRRPPVEAVNVALAPY